MVFPLHSVSGPGSKQLLDAGIEAISNRLKNQQAVTALLEPEWVCRGGAGVGEGGGGVGLECVGMGWGDDEGMGL